MTHKEITFDNYILFELSGEFEFKYLENIFSIIKNRCSDKNKNKAMIDCQKTINMFSSEIQRFYIGKTIAGKLRGETKLAAVISVQKFNKFGELAARNRGANMKVFTTREEAEDWLLN